MPRIGDMPVSEDVAELNPDLIGMPSQKSPKYHNRRVTLEGMTFDSGYEATKAQERLAMLRAKELLTLAFQVAFPLAGGSEYVADFVSLDKNLVIHIEDAKGYKTKEYKLKRKLFKERYGRDIEEV